MYKVNLLLLMMFTQVVIQFTQCTIQNCTTILNIAILHKIAINMMQNNKSGIKLYFCIIIIIIIIVNIYNV